MGVEKTAFIASRSYTGSIKKGIKTWNILEFGRRLYMTTYRKIVLTDLMGNAERFLCNQSFGALEPTFMTVNDSVKILSHLF